MSLHGNEFRENVAGDAGAVYIFVYERNSSGISAQLSLSNNTFVGNVATGAYVDRDSHEGGSLNWQHAGALYLFLPPGQELPQKSFGVPQFRTWNQRGGVTVTMDSDVFINNVAKLGNGGKARNAMRTRTSNNG